MRALKFEVDKLLKLKMPDYESSPLVSDQELTKCDYVERFMKSKYPVT